MHRAILKRHLGKSASGTRCSLINHCINKGGPSQMGGSYTCSWGEHTTGLEQLNGGHGMFIPLHRAILKGHWVGGRNRKKC